MSTADDDHERPDPAELPPLCGEEEFGEMLVSFVADTAPRLFAVIQEYGMRADARVAGWGLAHEGHADLVGVDGDVHLGASRPENLLRRFGQRDRITTRIVWHDPAAATPDEDSDTEGS